MKLAILGLGGIGRALAARAVDRGHQVTGWNRTPRTFDVPTVPTPGEAVAGVDLALIVVADDRAVSELCTTELLAALPPQALLLVVSTVAPSTVRDIDLPGRVLDTPVLGAPELIAAGSGQFLVGGDEAAAQRAGELLDDLGAGHTYCGPLGAGAVMKIVSNLQLVIGVAAMSEAIAIAAGTGCPMTSCAPSWPTRVWSAPPPGAG